MQGTGSCSGHEQVGFHPTVVFCHRPVYVLDGTRIFSAGGRIVVVAFPEYSRSDLPTCLLMFQIRILGHHPLGDPHQEQQPF